MMWRVLHRSRDRRYQFAAIVLLGILTSLVWMRKSRPPWRVRATLNGSMRFVRSVAFSPNGRVLAVSGLPAQGPCTGFVIELWNVGDATLRKSFCGIGDFLSFSSDGSTLIVNNASRTTGVWDVETGEHRKLPKWAGPRRISPDGRTLAVADEEGQIFVSNLHTGETRAIPMLRDAEDIEAHSEFSQKKHSVSYSSRYELAFSPDGTKLAVSSYEGWVIVWNLVQDKKEATIRPEPGYQAPWLVFSPDGATLAIGATDVFTLFWDLAEGREKTTLPYRLPREGPVFSPDGKMVAQAGWGVSYASVFDTATGKRRTRFGRTGSSYSAFAFLPDGKSLTFPIMQKALKPAWWEKIPMLARMFPSKLGKTVLKHWDMHSGELETTGRCRGSVRQMSFTADGRTLATGMEDGSILLWDVQQ